MDQAQRLTYPHITGDVKFHFLIHFQLFPTIQCSTNVQKASHNLNNVQLSKDVLFSISAVNFINFAVSS